MRLLITGASGFIGTHLVTAAVAHGLEVIALSRKGVRPEGAAGAFAWAFGQPVTEAACKDITCAVHLAHDFDGEPGSQRTIKSTLAMISRLRDAGVQRQLFFSSYSAGEYATSLYGRTKYLLEQALVNQEDVIIVRPGLVLGEGGIYGRIRKWATTLPVVPLPGGGSGRVPVITIEKLCEATISLAISDHPVAEANIFEHELKTLRALVIEVAAEAGRRPWILPIPAKLLAGVLRLAAYLHVPLPVNADNLDGFMANQLAGHISKIENMGINK